MEKYGVEQDETTKTASNGTCRECGRTLSPSDTTGGVLKCPVCGTRPYEKGRE